MKEDERGRNLILKRCWLFGCGGRTTSSWPWDVWYHVQWAFVGIYADTQGSNTTQLHRGLFHRPLWRSRHEPISSMECHRGFGRNMLGSSNASFSHSHVMKASEANSDFCQQNNTGESTHHFMNSIFCWGFGNFIWSETWDHLIFLGGCFKDFWCSRVFGEDEPNLTSIFFRWVGSTTNQYEKKGTYHISHDISGKLCCCQLFGGTFFFVNPPWSEADRRSYLVFKMRIFQSHVLFLVYLCVYFYIYRIYIAS